ncbi:LysM peptidoglycan-binding domain-containing protein [Paenibacillus tianjinensis]|uniref:LysM peptidoglycan-binding domain-containing protein n=1 Tax=Paenibacillus tianjinensis TaxID=2810347 RepID=A0ABX7LAN2_9BACL|nr:LysM peptidoglycan-binding domain-containing protein [Paenibacillus tianjinensis]QSF44089.1 LysM peptidoglycan-binding domain-containing protein [Paenibacillus tianjinensis]
MFDQSHGLRFDIYERIHLSDELPGIAELEEVELIPDIQVIQREDRAELYGQLLLTGLYRGENDRTERLEHAIPVEITVPLTRVSSLEDIGVEIENFDVDLLTMRTVNITGVLSLRGIGGTDTGAAWQQEEYTVAYSPEHEGRGSDAPAEPREHDNDALYENSLWTYGEGAAEAPADEHENAVFTAEAAVNPLFVEGSVYTQPAGSSAQLQKDKEEKLRTHSFDSHKGSAEPLSGHFFGAREKAEAANTLNSPELAQVSGSASLESVIPAAALVNAFEEDIAGAENYAVNREEPSVAAEAEDNAPPEVQAQDEAALPEPAEYKENEVFHSPETLPAHEEKTDLKIALGSKKEEETPAKEHLTFSSLLSSSRAHKEQETAALSGAVSAVPIPEAGNDSEWKSRFIGGLGGAELFRKVRLCIVQREDTLDTIAEKYQLSARELVMYNRLSGQNVEEGQVLYIP